MYPDAPCFTKVVCFMALLLISIHPLYDYNSSWSRG